MKNIFQVDITHNGCKVNPNDLTVDFVRGIGDTLQGNTVFWAYKDFHKVGYHKIPKTINVIVFEHESEIQSFHDNAKSVDNVFLCKLSKIEDELEFHDTDNVYFLSQFNALPPLHNKKINIEI